MTEIYQDDNYSVVISSCAQNTTLFNRADFLNHQRDAFDCEIIVFELRNIQVKSVVASIDFACTANGSEWRTPVTGAFSSLSGLKSLSFAEIALFIGTVSDFLFNIRKATMLSWRTPPLYYHAILNHKVHNVLFRSGWKIVTSDLNFHLPVTDYATFRSQLAGSKRKELNKITRSETRFEIATSCDVMREIWDVIKMNRQAQGYPMTMSAEALLALNEAIKGDLMFTALKRDNTTLAGAILMNIDEKTRYVFYWGEHPDFRHESPVIKLCEHLYLEAADKGYRYLDIGISTVNSVPNEGLVNFKMGIGCEMSQKLTFTLSAQVPV
ncbi:GNAT family N-acetyltransferase [Enterobacter kobei]|uniref:GNAT family N-acetyltransferase n=1 Tax=Enterobacter kobei TaxID=208224 RepID=UPI003A980B4D